MKCLNCGKEFTAVRTTAKYCSTNCRVNAGRHSVTTSMEATDISVTKLSVTDKTEGEPAPDLIDYGGNTHARTWRNGIATVYPKLADVMAANEERRA